MKKIYLATILLIPCYGLSAMKNTLTAPQYGTTIQVPSTIIYERLNNMHLNQFLAKRPLHKTIGDRPLYPIGFIIAVDNEIVLYLKDIRKRSNNLEFIANSSEFMEKIKPHIINAILKDHPAAIENLIQEGWLKEQSNKKSIYLNNKLSDTHWDVFIKNK
jgi:hypothetical protein